MFANQHFVSSSESPYKPFHSNNMDFAIGGPIIPHHNSFFYFAVEPLRSSSSAGGSVTFAAPNSSLLRKRRIRIRWEPMCLSTYLPNGVGGINVLQTGTRCFRLGSRSVAEPPPGKMECLALCP